MSLKELQKFLLNNLALYYSESTLKKWARYLWADGKNTNQYGYTEGVKKTSAGYDVFQLKDHIPQFAKWLMKNVKSRGRYV